jgi:hypothetical protein
VTESLADFQSSLGRALTGEDTCPVDSDSPGFHFTMAVRRSWCESRSIVAARAVLKLVSECDRQCLLSEYVQQGGGSAWFQATESERFLAFLSRHLPNPSHALTICRVSQALTRARLGTSTFVAPDERVVRGPVGRGSHAELVWFYADPGAVLTALNGGEVPRLGQPSHALLFAPGINNLSRIATDAEATLWYSLAIADAPPALVATLLLEGVLAYPIEYGAPK